MDCPSPSKVSHVLTKKQTFLSEYAVFMLGCVLTLFFSGGLILGFGPLYSTLVSEGVWHEKCPTKLHVDDDDFSFSNVCPQQAAALSRLFTCAYLGLPAFNAMFGILLDIIGPRQLTVFGCAVSVVGNLSVAYANTSVTGGGWLLTIGLTLIGAGGMAVFLSCFPLVKAFTNQGRMSSILGSFFPAASYIYMLLQVTLLPMSTFFTAYAILAAVAGVIVWTTYPSKAQVLALQPQTSRSSMSLPLVQQSCREAKEETPHRLSDTTSIPVPPPSSTVELLTLLKTRTDLHFFILYYCWMFVLTGYAWKSFPALLTAATSTSDDLGAYTSYWFPFICNASFLVAPLLGYLIDTHGFRLVIGLNLSLSLLFIASVLVVTSRGLYIGVFIIFLCFNGSLFMMQGSYILMEFPVHLFGSIQCVLQVASFTAGLTMFGISELTPTQGFLLLAVGPLLLSVLGLGYWAVLSCQSTTLSGPGVIKFGLEPSATVAEMMDESTFEMPPRTPPTNLTKTLTML